MCEELMKEIENAKTLGRSERRKKERELQKKYNDGSIRVLSSKTFTKGESLKRKDRRELIKDKNLLKELINIINKYFPMLMCILWGGLKLPPNIPIFTFFLLSVLKI